MKTLKHKLPSGAEIKLFPVGTLADMIDRDRQTIKRWEKNGMIPKAPFTTHHGKKLVRLYPEYFGRALRRVIKNMGIRKGKSFDAMIVKRKIFNELEKEKNKL